MIKKNSFLTLLLMLAIFSSYSAYSSATSSDTDEDILEKAFIFVYDIFNQSSLDLPAVPAKAIKPIRSIKKHKDRSNKGAQGKCLKKVARSVLKNPNNYAAEAAKVTCLLEQPEGDVWYGNEYFNADEIKALLCVVINHISSVDFPAVDLVSDRDNLWPHQFHLALQVLALKNQKMPFIISLENEPSLLCAYDQFSVVESKQLPEGVSANASYSEVTYYQLLLTSTSDKKAQREYRYWIFHGDKNTPVQSEWIKTTPDYPKPDCVMTVRSKGDLRSLTAWQYDFRLEPAMNIDIKDVYYLYSKALRLHRANFPLG